MTLDKQEVHGLDALRATLAALEGKKTFVLFTGSHVNGKSWCPDCVAAEPVIESVLASEPIKNLDVAFVTCFVGEMPYWKDPKCPFRTEPDLKLTCVPTLIEYGKKHKRLLDDQLTNHNLIKELLTDED